MWQLQEVTAGLCFMQRGSAHQETNTLLVLNNIINYTKLYFVHEVKNELIVTLLLVFMLGINSNTF